MSNKHPDTMAIDFASFRPLAWIFIAAIALWIIYFIALPAWAAWTIAIMFGLLTSFVLGIEIRAFQIRRIERAEAKRRAAIQEELDHAGNC